MANVVGLTVWVKLKAPPPNNILYGVVKALEPGSHVTLESVFAPSTNARWPEWTIQATSIDNLEVVDPSSLPQLAPAPPPPPPQPPFQGPSPFQQQPYNPVPPSNHQPPFAPPISNGPPPAVAPQPIKPHSQPPHELIDPAIVSYGTASPVRPRDTSRAEVETPIKSMLARAAANLPSPGSPFIAEAGKVNVAQKLREAAHQLSTAQAPKELASTPAELTPLESAQNEAAQDTGSKKKARRGQRAKNKPSNPLDIADPPPVMNTEVSRNGNDMNGAVKRGKGWRNTPLLQPSPQTASPLDKANTKKSRRKQRDDEALGDTTDIADMGDFDFEGELKKFDKKQVFDEIRQGDTTADEDRLVSHNKARPGTYGGKNLHPTEPVLSPPTQPVYNSNELDSASEADTELNMANGRSSSKHSVSRAVFPKTKPSRQNSGHVFDGKHPIAASLSTDMQRTRSTASLVSRTKATSLAATSPQPDRASSPQSGGSFTKILKPQRQPVRLAEPHFVIGAGEVCPTLLPKALENLEIATVSTFGLSHAAITETAGRSIAEAAMQLISGDGFRRPSRTNTQRGSLSSSALLESNDPPVVVVLAGNHPTGARALAAARHLLGRNYRVIAAESLFESVETQDQQSKAQISILRRMARGGAMIKRGLWRKASAHIKNLSGPPVIIIDALLAGETYDSLLSTNVSHSAAVQQETREMIDWANRSRAPKLCVGCPSGVSGIDGSSTIVDGEPLSVRPEKVLALGAPFQGLLKAIEVERLEISVADIGLNIALKSEEAVAFGAGGWLADLKYENGTDVNTTAV